MSNLDIKILLFSYDLEVSYNIYIYIILINNNYH